MGREIRRVPPHWDHPRDERGQFEPMMDKTYKEACQEWKAEFFEWERGKRPSYYDDADYPDGIEYWDWSGNPPSQDVYRPEFTEPATWWQVYETVSEGTPTTPPFPTREDLIDHLCEYGQSWMGEKYRDAPWSRDAAEAFVDAGWIPSGLMSIQPDGTKLLSGAALAEHLAQREVAE